MLARLLSRRIAILAVAAVAITTAAAVAPNDAKALVRFGDGVQMFVEFDCNYDGSYSKSVFNSSGQIAYARTRIYDQYGRSLSDSGWVGVRDTFTIWGPMRWPYGHGWFTFRSLVGRYVNGQWVMARDLNYVCLF